MSTDLIAERNVESAFSERDGVKSKLITIITPCYNEVLNVREVHRRVMAMAAQLPEYRFEHLFVDNASKDGTVDELRKMAAEDPSVKVIVNARNFGADRSGMNGLLQAQGDAVGSVAADLQDPPELFVEMIREWEKGFPIVAAIKNSSDESGLMYRVRTAYYRLVARLTNVEVLEHFTGFGLYDRLGDRANPQQFPRPLSLLSRNDRGTRAADCQGFLQPETSRARDHFEQFLLAL